ncbi:MAG: glycosyltransferase family 4 protein [Sarcina sp.]
MKSKEIVIVTKYFGHNFTGATLATHELMKRWSKSVDKIKVISRIIGKYDELDNLEIIKCENNNDMIEAIKKTNDEAVVYSDDHLAYLITKAGKNYYHTYHATWPEARWIDYKYFIKSFGFIPLYKKAIRNSIKEITVSNKYKKWVELYNPNSIVIRNGLGINQEKYEIEKTDYNVDEFYKIIMMGNIDGRKYDLAVQLFKKVKESGLKVKVDIYGRELDSRLRAELESFEFVNFKGFVSDINIIDYDIFINTSKNENLSIAICEAIKVKVPAICFNVGAMGEIVKNGDNGFIIDNNNVEEMFSKLKLIVEENYRFKFQDKTIEEFNWDKSAKLYLKEFNL